MENRKATEPSIAEREIILRGWKDSDHAAIIKDVATKGSHIDMCVEYLAKTRNMSIQESKKFFNHHVNIYINRLLRQKLIYKAESVLRNCGRNVEHVYYQVSYSTGDIAFKIILREHLKKQDPSNFDERANEYETYCRMLAAISNDEALNQRVTEEIGEMKLENLYLKNEEYRKALLVSAYFELRHIWMMPHLDRMQVWHYLVSKSLCTELVTWARIYHSKKLSIPMEIDAELASIYNQWDIDDEMFLEALSIVKPPESLRNLFAANGYIFPDERDNVQKVLLRIFTTETFARNKYMVAELPLVDHIIHNESYNILFDEAISNSDIENAKPKFASRSDDMDVIIALKTYDIRKPQELVKLSKCIANYLQKSTPNIYDSHPVIRLFELLGGDVSLNELHAPENKIVVEKLPYVREVLNRIHLPQPECTKSMEDFLRKFNQIDLREICNGFGNEPISFSNENFSLKYAPKAQLNYCDFIRQKRTAYGVFCYLIEQLSKYAKISKSQLCLCAEHVTELALENSLNADLVLNCIAFIEMLGFDTKAIRAYLKLKQLSKDTVEADTVQPDQLITLSEIKLFETYPVTPEEFPLRTYNAIVTTAKSVRTNVWPEIYLSRIAIEDDWLHFVLFVQYFDIPLVHLSKFTRLFKTSSMGDHLIRALSYDSGSEKSKRHHSFSRSEYKRKTRSLYDEKSSQATSVETFTSSSSSDASQLQKSRNQLKLLQQFEEKDLFALILLSASDHPEDTIGSFLKYLNIMNEPQSYCMSWNLLRNAETYQFPVLAVLSAVVNDRNVEWCWLTWLLSSTGLYRIMRRCPNEQPFAFALIEECVRTNKVRTLNQSFQIFYRDNEFTYLTKFLVKTSELNFTEEAVLDVVSYFQSISNDNIALPLNESYNFTLSDFSIKLIFLHMKYNFTSLYHRQLFLDVLCKASLSKPRHDFELLRRAVEIIAYTGAEIDYERLVTEPGYSIRNECKRICTFLESENKFDKAIQLATLLNLQISSIIYAKWLFSLETTKGDINFDEYEKETDMYILPPEILVNFYILAAARDTISKKHKYHIYERALEVTKNDDHLISTEYFDKNNIEFEMVLIYLESNLTLDDLKIFHSKYYEQVLVHERCVLYKSFPELKELADIENIRTKKIDLIAEMKQKLEVLINRLLDDGDIVQALRYQAMFDHRPVDLHFIVYCMALAEGLANVYKLPSSLRCILTDVDSNPRQFGKRTLGRTRSQAGNMIPTARSIDAADSNPHLEFEEIPSREKQDILMALQGIVSRMEHGVNIGKRIMMVYRAAMHLDKDYSDVLKTKDPLFLLKNAIEEDCLEKLVVINDILISSQLSDNEAADFLSSEIATAIVRPRFYILNPSQSTTIENNLWGFNLEKDFHLILELNCNSILLGNCLLDYCDALKVYRKYQDNKDYEKDLEENQQLVNAFDSLRDIIRRYGLPSNHTATSQVLSHKKQNTIYVELLIKAHECFVHELSMEGIANILNRAKTLNSVLSAAKSWNLIVRMLTGIGRYREMYYCIETLISNDQFESLLGQFDDEKSKGLRQAIIQYIHEFCPQNREYYRLTALHFSMFKELAEMWETEGNAVFAKIISNYEKVYDPLPIKGNDDVNVVKKSRLWCSSELLIDLSHAIENFTHATENYLMDNKLHLAQKTVAQAELAAMQNHLASAALAATNETCLCILNIRKQNVFKEIVCNDLSIPQALILQRAYSYEINWSEAILSQYILLDRKTYIEDYCNHFDLRDNIIENIVASFQQLNSVTSSMEENMSNLVELVQSVSLRYKLASLLGFRRIITALINDQSLYYLKDTNYGRNEIDFN